MPLFYRTDVKNSPLSSVTTQFRFGTSSLHRNTSLHHSYTEPIIDRNHCSSNEDIKHGRSSSRDSADYAYLISKYTMSLRISSGTVQTMLISSVSTLSVSETDQAISILSEST